MSNRFNLLEENWIPVAGEGRVSLRRIFTGPPCTTLGGTPLQKISILKLLLAIAQSAHTPEDNEDWLTLGPNGLAAHCLKYLEAKQDLFWLYGEKPFLQMPKLREARHVKGKELTFHTLGKSYLPDISSENDSIVFDIQRTYPLSDAEKAVFLVSLMNYAPAGKRVDYIEPLEIGGKPSNSAKAGPSLGNYVGFLNSCLWSDNIQNTIWLNLFTREDIHKSHWEDKSVIPPWEEMPVSEAGTIAERIQKSIMGSLCALSRFVLFDERGMIYTEGLRYPSHKEGWRETFFAWYAKGKDFKFLWLDTGKKPWRELIALLNTPMNGGETTHNCPQISMFWPRARKANGKIGIWSGGLQVRGTAGDQSVKQTDDFVESFFIIDPEIIKETWFEALKSEIRNMEQLSKVLYSSIRSYLSKLKVKPDKILNQAQYLFWQLCERHVQDIIGKCGDDLFVDDFRRRIVNYVNEIYNRYCPNHSARQMEEWVKNRPSLGRYLTRKEEGQ